MAGLLSILLFFLLPGATSSAGAAGGGGKCNRQCNGTVVPYPFGFSGDCPILLSCNASTSTAHLRRNTAAAVPYNVSSFNSTTSTFITDVVPSCNRSVLDAKASLSGANYAVSSRTKIILGRGCRARASVASSCTSADEDFMDMILRRAQCSTAGGNDTDRMCVPSTWNITAVAEGPPQFLEWAKVEATGCQDVLLEATVWQGTGLFYGEAEMVWWLNGTCASGGQCATCRDVQTPSGAWGHRCTCLYGMVGDGFAAGDGCHALHGKQGRKQAVLAVAAGVSVGFILLIIGLSAFCLRQKRRQNGEVVTKTSKQALKDAKLFRGKAVDEDDLEPVRLVE